MISEIQQAVVDELKSLYPSAGQYLGTMPQDFQRPSFLTAVVGQDYKKRLAGVYRSTLSLDVAYYSAADTTEIQSDCLGVQETLLRSFDLVGEFRITNKDAKITDQVLHLKFNVTYLEKRMESGTSMGTVSTNFVTKE